MIFDAIALIVLSGMMLVPLINIVVGLIVGAWLGGPAGALVGIALAVLISAIEKQFGDRLGWFEPETTVEETPAHIAAPVTRARHAALSTPVYFTEPMPPLPLMVASAVRSDGDADARHRLH